MHGHGDNPYRCKIRDCRRSQPDQGFPRRWNARDHMKRVHGIEISGPDSEDELDTVPEEPLALALEPATRKRIGSRNAVPMKKTASSQSKRSTRSNPEERRTSKAAAGQEAQRRQSFPAQTVSIVAPGSTYYDGFAPADMYPYTGFGPSYQAMDGVFTYQC